MPTPQKDKARRELVARIIERYGLLQYLPYPAPDSTRRHYVCLLDYKKYLTCQYQSPDWRQVFFMPQAEFDKHIAPTLSEYGLTVYRIANEAEWAELEKFKQQLLA